MLNAVTFRAETWEQARDDMSLLWDAYWDEIRDLQEAKQIKPDDAIYEHYDKNGMLVVVTARVLATMELAGFQVVVLSNHLNHADTLCAFGSAWYVKPEYRKGLTGYRLLCETEKQAKNRGAQRMYMEVTPRFNVDPILVRRGWSEATRQYCKEL